MQLKTILGLIFVAKTNQFGIYSDEEDVKIIMDRSVSLLSGGITKSKFIRHCGSKPCGIHNFNAITQDRGHARKLWYEYSNCAKMENPERSVKTCYLQRSCKARLLECVTH